MVLKFESKNIGGNIGDIKLEFNEGINIIRAPNTTGKTSIIRGLGSLFIKNTKNARDVLNLTQRRGEISLASGEQVWQKTFINNNGKVSIAKSTGIVDDRFGYLIADYNNHLLTILNEGNQKRVMEGIEKFITVLSNANSYIIQLESKKNEAVKIEDFLKEHESEIRRYLELQKKEIDISKKIIENETMLNGKLKEAYKSNIELIDLDKKQRGIHSEIIELAAGTNLLETEVEELNKDILAKQKKIGGFSEEKFRKLENEYQKVRGEIEAFVQQIQKTVAFVDIIKEHKSAKNCPICNNKVSDWNEKQKTLKEKIKELEQERDCKISESETLEKEYDEWKNIPLVKNDLEEILKLKKRATDEQTKKLNEKKIKQNQQAQLLKKIESFKIKIGVEDKALKEKNEGLEEERSKIVSELKKLEKTKNEKEEREKVLEELQIKIAELKKQYETELHKARQFFNNEIKDVLNRLAFKDFKKVEIGKDFGLTIDRAEIKNQPLTTLSGSERTTIGLLLLLSAHKAYIKQIPVFLADETTFSYDPTRFKRFAIYLKRNIPYTILTALAPEGEPLKVEMIKE